MHYCFTPYTPELCIQNYRQYYSGTLEVDLIIPPPVFSRTDVQADLTAVDWSSLMAQTPIQTEKKPSEEAGSILDKFRPGQVLARVGISRALAGSELMKEVEKICLKASEGIQVPVVHIFLY